MGRKLSIGMHRSDGAAAAVRAGLAPGRPAAWVGGWASFAADAPGLLCLAGFDGRFRRLSPAWSGVLGWSARQLQGRSYLALIHPDDRGHSQAQLARLARDGGQVQFESRWQAQDGGYRWLQWQAGRVTASTEFQAVAHDVTDTQRLKREVLDATDRERARLGRELHDGLCQNLSGIAALSAALARRLAVSGAQGPAAEVAEIGGLLNHAVVYARDLARGLCPAELRGAGLADALAALADNVSALFGVRCVFDRPPACPDFGPETATHLYRIAQEAVHNALVHGRGQRIDIALRIGSDSGLLCIRDDGAGPAGPDAVERGMGLQSMRYRAQWIGGALQVQGQAAGGTAVRCTFPLAPHGSPGPAGGAL